MTVQFPVPPTYASPVLQNQYGKTEFNPIWLKWFVDVAQFISSSGGGSGTLTHNNMGGLQGGSANQYYHFTSSEHSVLAALGAVSPANNKIPRFTGASTADLLSFSTDGTLSGNSDTTLSSEKAVKTYVDGAVTTITAATQSDQETATSTTTYVSPGRQQYHPSAAKVWVHAEYSAGVPSIGVSYNVSSLTDVGTGVLGVNFTVSFSTAKYAICPGLARGGASTGLMIKCEDTGQAAGSCQISYYNSAGTLTDPTDAYASCFGDQ